MMIYNSGKEEKKGDCCGKCIHFCAVCKVSDIDKSFLLKDIKIYTQGTAVSKDREKI